MQTTIGLAGVSHASIGRGRLSMMMVMRVFHPEYKLLS